MHDRTPHATPLRYAPALVAMCLSLCGGIPTAATSAPTPATQAQEENRPATLQALELRQLFEQHRFGDLNRMLSALQSRTEHDVTQERALAVAYGSFRAQFPEHEAHHEAWVKALPRSHHALIARAQFNFGRAWAARGVHYASATSRGQFADMERYMKLARQDAEEVVRLNPKCIPAYSLLINIARATSNKALRERAYAEGIHQSPASYILRASYIQGLQPRWGGSLQEMQSFAKRAQGLVEVNPQLKLLEGKVFADMGNILVESKDRDEAESQFNRALTFGESADILLSRARNRMSMARTADALADVDRAIALDPDGAKYREWRSRILAQQGDPIAATAPQLQALALAPPDEGQIAYQKWLVDTLIYRGNENMKSGQMNKALAHFDAAMSLNPASARLRTRRAAALAELGKFDAARSEVGEAVKLAPDDIDAYLMADWVLARQKDWPGIIRYWNDFIARHPDNGRAYLERGGAHFRKGDRSAAVEDARRAGELGNLQGREFYERYR